VLPTRNPKPEIVQEIPIAHSAPLIFDAGYTTVNGSLDIGIVSRIEAGRRAWIIEINLNSGGF